MGISLSVLAAIAIARQERTNQRLQFQRQTDSLTTSLQRSVNRYTDILLSLGDFYTVSEQTVPRAEFDRFVKRALATYPGIQALEWAPVVLTDSTADGAAGIEPKTVGLPTRTDFEATVRAEGYRTFQITEQNSQGELVRAGDRTHYVPVTYVQPYTGNEPALGYDLSSDSIRRTALEAARDTGSVAASGRIRLVQENNNQFGFLVFLPLYSSRSSSRDMPESVLDRQAQLQGYLLGVFRVAEVVEESLETLSYDIDFVLSDRTAPENEFLGLYQASSRTVTTEVQAIGNRAERKQKALCPTAETCTHQLRVGGRLWAIAFTPAANYPATTLWRALSTFITGLLLTLMVARYFAQAQSALIKTQELSALKIRLFSMASHELRTPLASILLSAQVLEAGLSRTDRPRVYSRIRAAAKRMNQLLGDLLTLARAESGKLEFSPETLNLPSFCQQIIEEVQFSFEAVPAIDFVVSPSVPTAAYLDPQLLRAVLTNLLSNAVKYSNEPPQVSMSVACQSHHLVFRVSDRGIGIPSADQARLNDAFYRGQNVGHIPGTGLGLSVVSACLQLHRGSLVCESTLGEGTTFTVTLPRIE
nr:CHASE domain-containing protein [cf. Phormidesmis sp. LEGE 11477]